MTTIDDFTTSISAGFESITSPSGKLSHGSMEMIDRKEALDAVLLECVSMRDGRSRNILVSGETGSGRSYFLSFIANSMKQFNDNVIMVAFSNCNKLSDFTSIFPIVIDDSGKNPVVFIDDIDLMLISWNTNDRFLNFLSWLSKNNYSIIATTSSTPSSLIKIIEWTSTINISLLSRKSIALILKNLVQKNVSREFAIDDFAMNYCALFAIKKFNSSISLAIAIMEHAIKLVAREFASGNRADRTVVMKDIENGANELQSNKFRPCLAGNKVLIMATFFIMKRATVKELQSRISRIMPTIYPDKKLPSLQTIRYTLRSMVSAGLARKTRSSNGKSSGVKTKWECDLYSSDPGVNIPGEILRMITVIANGGKHHE